MSNQQKWNVGDTVYTEPAWSDLDFCKSFLGDKDGYRYKSLKEKHTAILLKRGCGLIAVMVDPGLSDDKRKEVQNENGDWYATFEDAIDELVSRVHVRLVSEQDQLTGVMQEIQHQRNRS